MTYKQKLTKIGNSVGIIFPKHLLESLGLEVGQELFLENMKDKIIIEKKPTGSVSPEFLKIAEKIGKKYKEAFKELASK